MTMREYQESVEEWIANIKVGDEVCITNLKDIARNTFESLFGMTGINPNTGEEQREICIISKVRGVLPDGSVVVDKNIYNKEGKLESKTILGTISALKIIEPSLHPVTDELREQAARFIFIDTMKRVRWDKISSEAMAEIGNIITNEGRRVQKEKEEVKDANDN